MSSEVTAERRMVWLERDDGVTLAAVGAVAFVLADVTHEALGHGLATLAVGAKPVDSRCWRNGERAGGHALPAYPARLAERPAARPLLSGAGNVVQPAVAARYPAYSGIAGFGDWAAVTSGLSPAWLWRVVLVVVSGIAYYLSLRLIAKQLQPFCGSRLPVALARFQRLT